jgi:hypothetical protein
VDGPTLCSMWDHPLHSLLIGLFLRRWLWRVVGFAALGADEGLEVFRVKRIASNGLLSGGAQGDVHAAIVSQDQDGQFV